MTLRWRLLIVIAAAALPLALLAAWVGIADWRPTLGQHLLLVAVALLVGVGAAGIVGSRLLVRPIQEILPAAPRHDQRGEFTRLRALVDDLTGQVAQAARGKDAAIRDAHHRVLNSLHLLSAIFHLHARQLSDDEAKRHLDEARERVVGMSLIYRHLCDTDATQSVELAELLRGFCAEAAESCRGPAIEVVAEPAELPTEMAMNLGLLVHEILARAGGQTADGDGALRVELRRRADGLRLEVVDSRPGASAGFAAESSRSLGMMIVQSLSRQLRGRFTVERRGAATVLAVSVPLPDEAPASADRAVA